MNILVRAGKRRPPQTSQMRLGIGPEMRMLPIDTSSESKLNRAQFPQVQRKGSSTESAGSSVINEAHLKARKLALADDFRTLALDQGKEKSLADALAECRNPGRTGFRTLKRGNRTT
jgi:hypothetical protein